MLLFYDNNFIVGGCTFCVVFSSLFVKNDFLLTNRLSQASSNYSNLKLSFLWRFNGIVDKGIVEIGSIVFSLIVFFLSLQLFFQFVSCLILYIIIKKLGIFEIPVFNQVNLRWNLSLLIKIILKGDGFFLINLRKICQL